MSEDKVVTLGGFEEGSKQRRKVYDTDGLCPTLQAAMGCGGGNNPFVLEMKLLGNIYGEHCGTGYAGNVWDSNGLAPTLMTMQGGNRQPMVLEVKEVDKQKLDPKWIFEVDGEKYYIRIRKLTPKECFRLMGFNDEEYEKAASVNSNTQLYKEIGNSIVVDVLEAIFGELFKDEQG